MARPTLTTHRKFRRLARLLGGQAVARGTLELVWDTAYASGEARIGDALDVEEAAQWQGERGACVQALVACGFLDRAPDGETFEVHDLFDHAPDYVVKRRQRELERKERGYSVDRNGLSRNTVRAVFERASGIKCEQCGSTESIHIDHIIPSAAGGSDELDNLRLLCKLCNLKKSGPDRVLATRVRRSASSDQETAPRGAPPAPAPARTPALKSERAREVVPTNGTDVSGCWDAWRDATATVGLTLPLTPKGRDHAHLTTLAEASLPRSELDAVLHLFLQAPSFETKRSLGMLASNLPQLVAWHRQRPGVPYGAKAPPRAASPPGVAREWDCPHTPHCGSYHGCERLREIAAMKAEVAHG